MGKNVKQLPIKARLFVLDENNDFMPAGYSSIQFDIELNGDICPCVEIETEYDDSAFELDENGDITTRE